MRSRPSLRCPTRWKSQILSNKVRGIAFFFRCCLAQKVQVQALLSWAAVSPKASAGTWLECFAPCPPLIGGFHGFRRQHRSSGSERRRYGALKGVLREPAPLSRIQAEIRLRGYGGLEQWH